MELEKLASLVTRKIVALTNTERDEEVACGQARLEKFTVIPSGVDLSEYKPRAAEKDPVLCERFGVKPEQVVLGEAAWPLERPDAAMIASELEKVFKLSPEQRRAYIEKGRERIQQFAPGTASEKFAVLLKRILFPAAGVR